MNGFLIFEQQQQPRGKGVGSKVRLQCRNKYYEEKTVNITYYKCC